jgi:hypothetical protein
MEKIGDFSWRDCTDLSGKENATIVAISLAAPQRYPRRLVPEEIKACMTVDGFRQKIARTLSDRKTHAGK